MSWYREKVQQTDQNSEYSVDADYESDEGRADEDNFGDNEDNENPEDNEDVPMDEQSIHQININNHAASEAVPEHSPVETSSPEPEQLSEATHKTPGQQIPVETVEVTRDTRELWACYFDQ